METHFLNNVEIQIEEDVIAIDNISEQSSVLSKVNRINIVKRINSCIHSKSEL